MAEAPTPTTKRRLTIRSPSELAAMTFDESHIIFGPHILARGQNAAMVGPGGCGKTRLMYQGAICGSIGRKFLGFTTPNNDLRWLFLQVENDNRRLSHDFQFYQKWVTPAQWKKVNEHLFVHTLETDDDGFLSFDLPRNREMATECIGDLKPDIVVLDALQDFAFGDLNHDVAMFTSLSEIGRIVKGGDPLRVPFIIHHAVTGREAAGRAIGWERSGYGKGSKSLHQWARLQINVAPGSEAGDIIIVGPGKVSDAKEFEPFAARLNPDTMIYERDSEFSLVKWRSEVARRNAPIIAPGEVADLCGIEGMSKKQLADAVALHVDCTERTAYRAIERAVAAKKLIFIGASEKYVKA